MEKSTIKQSIDKLWHFRENIVNVSIAMLLILSRESLVPIFLGSPESGQQCESLTQRCVHYKMQPFSEQLFTLDYRIALNFQSNVTLTLKSF